jgi:hypothetical protein
MPEPETPIFKSDGEQEAMIGAFNASMDARDAAAKIGLEPQRDGESDQEFVTRVQPDLDIDTIKKASDMGIETEDQSRDKIYKAVMDKDPQYFERSFYQ